MEPRLYDGEGHECFCGEFEDDEEFEMPEAAGPPEDDE